MSSDMDICVYLFSILLQFINKDRTDRRRLLKQLFHPRKMIVFIYLCPLILCCDTLTLGQLDMKNESRSYQQLFPSDLFKDH